MSEVDLLAIKISAARWDAFTAEFQAVLVDRLMGMALVNAATAEAWLKEVFRAPPPAA